MDQQNNMVGEGVSFQRIRRMTGYLVGDLKKRFNDAKRAEERDRVKHGYSAAAQTPCGKQ